MRSVFNRDIARSIASSLGRFLAIAGIVALGCGFYAGLRMTAPDMRYAGDLFYDGTNLYDIRMLGTLGYSEDQVQCVRETEGVKAACASKSTDVMAMLNGEQYAMRIISFDANAAQASNTEDGVSVSSGDDSYLNRLVLAEGSWPTKAGECILSADRVMGTPIQVGDTVEVLYGSQDLDDVLTIREFRVTGLAHSSSYVSSITLGSTSLGSGSIQQFVYVTEDNFDEDFPYSEIYVQVAGADGYLAGGNAYKERVDEVADRLEAASGEIAQQRYEQVHDEAQSELDDAQAEYDQQKADAQQKIEDGQRELDDAAAQLADAQSQIDSGQAEYESGVAELADARYKADTELSTARQKLESAQEEVESGEAQLKDAQTQLDEQRAAFEQQRAEWQAGKDQYDASAAEREQIEKGLTQAQAAKDTLQATLDGMKEGDPGYDEVLTQLQEVEAQLAQLQAAKDQFDNAKAQLDEGETQLVAAQAQLDAAQLEIDGNARKLADARSQMEDGWNQYHEQESSTLAQLESAQQELDDAATQLDSAREELVSGKEEYEQGVADFNKQTAEAQQELDDAQAKIDDAQAEIDDIEKPEVYVLDRTSNYGVASYDSDAQRIDNIASVFPFIFFLVAALVALTTMTRMVEEERVIIGTYKALGYSRARITSKYLVYGAAASITGAVVGILVLSQVLPFVIAKAYAIIYNVPAPPLPLPVNIPLAFLSAGLGVGITLLATWAAVAATLREQPASLMLPRAPVAGKRILLQRIGPLWRHLSFSWKVTCRNLFRYKKRFWMTIAGIAGCTALLLTGLGLHDAIWDIIDKQYGPIVEYNVVVELADDIEAEDVDGVTSSISSMPDMKQVARAEHVNMQISSEHHETTDIEVTIPRDADKLSQLITFKERLNQKPIELTENSVILTEKMATTLDVKPGDVIFVYEQDDIGNPVGKGYELTVTDVMENYVGHALFVGKDTWAESVGDDLVYRAVYGYCTEDPDARAAFTQKLHDKPEVETVTYNDETIDSYRKMLSSVNMVVVVLVIAAAALAFIVLYNLTNINITERRREIASLKVLGFTKREVNAYIFREIVLLTLIGAAFGLLLGYFLEGFVVVTAEVDYVMFGRDIHLLSYVLGYILTIVFSVVVMVAMRSKLGNIDMVESLKSIE
ncbi:MAG: FtsX-like permease family protein [Eggerthellaceae bacterium]|nr:FtsX-like permease family protein [Eggerthellaceae bacterium]